MALIAEISAEDLKRSLSRGDILIMPTDTVYGLVCSALQPAAVKKMYELKQREGKPGTLLFGSVQQLIDMGFNSKDVDRAAQFWPRPTSVILTAPDSLEYLHMGRKSLAVRIPQPAWLVALLEATGPIATTSANMPGKPTVTSIEEARRIFKNDVLYYAKTGIRLSMRPSSIVQPMENGDIKKLR